MHDAVQVLLRGNDLFASLTPVIELVVPYEVVPVLFDIEVEE